MKATNSQTSALRAVIIGGGFAGINLARELSKNRSFDITVVDRNNYHFFPPLIYQVSTAFIEASSVSYPFRKLFQSKPNVRFRLAELVRVVPEKNKALLSNGELHYDYLVIATGAETNYFGMQNIKRHALPMKTVSDALALRNHLLQTVEKAAVTTDPVERKKLLTIVVAGGGPSGVEIAGMLADMKQIIFEKEYPELIGSDGGIIMVDALDRLLAPMSEKSQSLSLAYAEELGISVRLNKQVKDYDGSTVTFADGCSVQTSTLIWTAGVIAVETPGIPKEGVGKGRRLLVDEHNKIFGTKNIYAIGDVCLQTSDKNFASGHPQVAQVAIQQGKNLAMNFKRAQNHQPLVPFAYRDKGKMAIIGRSKAVVDLGNRHFRGFFAFAMWMFVHLFSLNTNSNRLRTFFNWCWTFLTKGQALGMILKSA